MTRPAVSLGLVIFGALPAHAQQASPRPGWGVEASLGISDVQRMDDVMPFSPEGTPTLGTDGFPDDGLGVGLEAIVFRQWVSGFRIGGGAKVSRQPFELENVRTDAVTHGEHLWHWGLFVEPRYAFRAASTVRPFVGARVGYASVSASPTATRTAFIEELGRDVMFEQRASLDAPGLEIGWSAGLEAWIDESMAIEVVGLLTSLDFPHADAERTNSIIDGGVPQVLQRAFWESDSDGVSMSLRAGLLVMLP